MNITELSPILVLIFISALAFSIAAILSIRSKKSRLSVENKDFIDIAIENKKRALNSKVGGMAWKTYIALLILCPSVMLVFSLLFVSPKPLCIVFAAAGLFIPEVIIRRQEKRQTEKFAQHYAASLRTLAASLGAGRSIEQAIDDVANNAFTNESIRRGYKQMSSDIKVGISLEQAFKRFADSCGSEDAQDVAAAMSLQIKVGGSEAQVVSAVSENIYERIMTRKEIKGYFASVDVFILLMDILPWAALMFLFVFSPQYMAPYIEDPTMTISLVAILIYTTVGSFIIRRKIKKTKGE